MSELTVDQKWRRRLRWIRDKFPPPRPTRVVLKKGLGADHGTTCLTKGNKFVVEIKATIPYWAKVDVLLHEWAHVLTWLGNDDKHHGEEWGLNYARIYQASLDWEEQLD